MTRSPVYDLMFDCRVTTVLQIWKKSDFICGEITLVLYSITF